ncbi:MAG: carbohydrate binding family 9 domain-containing protein [Bacteroidales bacterium]|nr:carbohydrate binding family 9 domain-containing protein [Bacteroidales bacterium]
MKQITTAIVIIAIFTATAAAQQLEKKRYRATETITAPVIDGIPDEEIWNTGNWAGDFTQFEPFEGRKSSQPTEFNILFDNSFIYVAFKAYDSAPDSIVNRITRRDQVDGDHAGISFDSYNDKRTGFTFIVSSSGVKLDLIHANDGMTEDLTWDPIWHVKTAHFDWGWAAEMKIPFTQLRFDKNSADVWGMEVFRNIYRHNETNFWQHIPRNASGLVHNFGILDGLQNVTPRKILDITPYAVAAYDSYEKEAENPFATGQDFRPSVGLDAKVGLTNNLTLDLTVNPDFGQVEADPSEVNLSAYETFFAEQRPFFIEGRNITSFRCGIGDGDLSYDGLFYSRRIGRQPQGRPVLEENEYARTPRNVRILGAAKITGKTNNGWSVGVVESLTQESLAEIDNNGVRTSQSVEPLTNYLIGRVQKDINEGNTIIGGMVTNTRRDLESDKIPDGSSLLDLHRSATTAGIDFTQYFSNRNWIFSMAAATSHVTGSSDAIYNTQTSSRHLFQRPDADYITADSTLTSLSGHGGNFQIGKMGGKWVFSFFTLWKSPGFETNDVGYMVKADDIMNVFWSQYRINEPFSIFHRIRFNTNHWTRFDFGGSYLGYGGNINIYTQYKNLWSTSINSNWNSEGISNNLLRGGPAIKTPGSMGINYSINSSDRKKLKISAFGSNRWYNDDEDNHSRNQSLGMSATWRPADNLRISLSPSWSGSRTNLQYVTTRDFEGEKRYIFGSIERTTVSMSLRVNYNLTPEISIQYWGQPYLASGDYSRFKMITETPMADSYNARFSLFDDNQIAPDGNNYNIDENGDGNRDYSFRNPNFNFDEFLSNLVVRWEFVPGSTLFLVWSQTRSAYSPVGDFILEDNLNNLFAGQKPHDVFLVKFSYRFGLR